MLWAVVLLRRGLWAIPSTISPSAKFLVGDGGLLRMVWMPKGLKEELKERLLKRGEELGVPNLFDKIADETVGTSEEEILPFLEKVGHPALSMDPIIG